MFHKMQFSFSDPRNFHFRREHRLPVEIAYDPVIVFYTVRPQVWSIATVFTSLSKSYEHEIRQRQVNSGISSENDKAYIFIYMQTQIAMAVHVRREFIHFQPRSLELLEQSFLH